MSKITVAFIKAAMVYFVLAMLIGIHMSRTGAVYPSMPIHVHFNLLGWMSMMVYGVAYHILPRFSGRPLWNERLSIWHFWLANIGLVGMALGWTLINGPGGGAILYLFALVEGVSIILFALNMFKTVKAATPPPPRPPARPTPPKPAPPKPASPKPAPSKPESKAPSAKATPEPAKAGAEAPKKKGATARGKKTRPAPRRAKKESTPKKATSRAGTGAEKTEEKKSAGDAAPANETGAGPGPTTSEEPGKAPVETKKAPQASDEEK